MLLLVLILVLIAFGLLVVALLSGSVLWAWVSVGVSVAAAAVLLVDWLQRRSAVRAGAEAGDAAAPRRPVAARPDRDPVVEPATEIIPAIRADARPHPSRAPAPAGRRRRTARGAGDGRSAGADTARLCRRDRRALMAVSARQSQIGHRT